MTLLSLSVFSFAAVSISEIELVSPAKGFMDGKNNTLQIKSHSTGNVSEIFVSSGDVVKQGDKLISFDNQDVIFKSQSLDKNGSNLENQLGRIELDLCATRL